MKNTHIEHPEDSILNGNLSVLDWFTANGNITAKIDGSPAIVWGRNPATGKQFVGTKSVFNKVKIKINHSHEEIDRNHAGEVATILHRCLDYLPQTDGIFQGDFIGFGGNLCYKPNTITYYFPEVITQHIIIAPHTYYISDKDLRDAIAYPLLFDSKTQSKWVQSDDDVLFVTPKVIINEQRDDIKQRCDFARQISTLCDFPSDKQVARLKKQLNTCIREGIDIDDLTQDALADDNDIDVNVLRLWKLVWDIKLDMFLHIHRFDDLDCYIGEEMCGHEGYVLSNKFGLFKIINREGFSKANFNVVRSN